jgi:hypothetical protein
VNIGDGATFKMLPVYRKVLESEDGSLSKPASASLTVAYKLMVLMVRSSVKSSSEGAAGPSSLAKWTAAADRC